MAVLEVAMTDDGIRARQKRAAQLRDQIQKLKKGSSRKPSDAPRDKTADESTNGHIARSPREYVHNRMRELDSKRSK